eukprot:Rmarinus@m.22480
MFSIYNASQSEFWKEIINKESIPQSYNTSRLQALADELKLDIRRLGDRRSGALPPVTPRSSARCLPVPSGSSLNSSKYAATIGILESEIEKEKVKRKIVEEELRRDVCRMHILETQNRTPRSSRFGSASLRSEDYRCSTGSQATVSSVNTEKLQILHTQLEQERQQRKRLANLTTTLRRSLEAAASTEASEAGTRHYHTLSPASARGPHTPTAPTRQLASGTRAASSRTHVSTESIRSQPRITPRQTPRVLSSPRAPSSSRRLH